MSKNILNQGGDKKVSNTDWGFFTSKVKMVKISEIKYGEKVIGCNRNTGSDK